MVKNSIDDYKIAIIPSKGCEQLEEGEITYFGLSTFYFYHNLAFRDFCKKYYKEILNKHIILLQNYMLIIYNLMEIL